MSDVSLGDPLSVHIQHEPRKGPPLASVGNGFGSRTSLPRHSGIDAGQRWKPSVFDFKTYRSGSTCPTCKGAGRIPKGGLGIVSQNLVTILFMNINRSRR